MVGSSGGQNWEFDGFKLLADKRLLVCDGTPVPLMSKAFDTLVFLVANRHRVVTKDELLHAVWPDVTVEEGNLTQQIFLLRKALGDNAQNPRYIVTVPGHGYRFTAPVTAISVADLPADVAAAPQSPSPMVWTRSRPVKAAVLVCGIVVLGTVLAFAWRSIHRGRPYIDPASIHVTRVTETGKATNAAISPDGRYVAYVESDGDEYSLWLKLFRRHSWLPDNDTIVYRDLNGDLNAVHRDGRTVSLPLPDNHKVVSGVSACGDGRYVVFQLTPGTSIWRVAPGTGGATQLTSGSIDAHPNCSPDGKWVVYASLRDDPSIWQVSIDGGEPILLIQNESFEALPSPSGRLMYYSTFEWDEHPVRIRRLRWVVISAHDRKRLFSIERPADVALGVSPAWAPDEGGLDYVATQAGISNIWRQPLTGGPPVQITHFTTGKIFSFAWSPDGRWLSLGSGTNRSDVVLISDGQ